MAAGIQLDKAQVNGTLGSIANELHRAFARVAQFKTWLDATPDATLLAAPYGFVQADIDVLRSAYADLGQLTNIYNGTVNLAVAKDFKAFVKLVYGFGL